MALDAGWAGVLGAAIGVAGTLAGNGLTYWLGSRRGSRLAEIRRKRLLQMLNGTKYTWRSLPVLAASIGADESMTAELLVEINARASMDNTGSWALVTRAPWPEDVQPEK